MDFDHRLEIIIMVVTPIILSPATLSILRLLSEMFEYLKQIEVTMIFKLLVT